MKREEEKLTRVTDQAQIRPGVLLESQECPCGAKAHRFIVVAPSDTQCPMWWVQSRHSRWTVSPLVHGQDNLCCHFPGVEKGPPYLFIVETGLTDEVNPYVAVPQKRPRERSVR